jgi:hypothetical protein
MPRNEPTPGELNAPRAAIIVVGAIIVLATILGLVGGNFVPHRIGMPVAAPGDPITIP